MTQLLTSPTPLGAHPSADESRVLLRGISWQTYTAILKDLGDSAVRLTYEDGRLEIELPGKLHETIRKLCGSMVERALERMAIEYEPEGSTTWRREAGLRGLDADDCYHIQNFKRVAGRGELDLAVDPPPDLAIEIEIFTPLVNKMEVYRGLKVPELWRIRADGSCEMFQLNTAGEYQPIAASVAIPLFVPDMITRYVRLRIS